MTSKPRPIHQPHREIRSTPDDTEPSFSYEQESFLPKSEEEIEDAFLAQLNSRSSFWRSSGSEGVGPAFSSMNMKQQRSEGTSENRGSSGEGEAGETTSNPLSNNVNPAAVLPSSVSAVESWNIEMAVSLSYLSFSHLFSL